MCIVLLCSVHHYTLQNTHCVQFYSRQCTALQTTNYTLCTMLFSSVYNTTHYTTHCVHCYTFQCRTLLTTNYTLTLYALLYTSVYNTTQYKLHTVCVVLHISFEYYKILTTHCMHCVTTNWRHCYNLQCTTLVTTL